jgi:hypothetical protein
MKHKVVVRRVATATHTYEVELPDNLSSSEQTAKANEIAQFTAYHDNWNGRNQSTEFKALYTLPIILSKEKP